MFVENKTPKGAIVYTNSIFTKLLAFAITALATISGYSFVFLLAVILAVGMDHLFGFAMAQLMSSAAHMIMDVPASFSWGMFVSNAASAVIAAFTFKQGNVQQRTFVAGVTLAGLIGLDLLCAALVEAVTPGSISEWTQWYAAGGVLSDTIMAALLLISDPSGLITKAFKDENPDD